MNSIKSLGLYRFRNFNEAKVDFEARVNVFHGENAQGKTNLLEAIHLLSNLQSFRTRKLGEAIMSGADKAAVRAEVDDGYGKNNIRVELERGGKKVFLNSKSPKSVAEYLSVMSTVFFGPQDMEIASGNQQLRRRYLDRVTFITDPEHLERLKKYNRALKQRNEGLRSNIGDLSVWTAQVAELGYEVHMARREALSKIRGAIKSIHAEISGGREEVNASLKFNGRSIGEGPQKLIEMMEHSEEDDRARGYTGNGVHRDRVEIKLDGREMGVHASQGQRRTMALALKLALLGWIKDESGKPPAFLLDDPGSELDSNRLGFLAEFIGGWDGQVFIATVNAGDIPLGKKSSENDINTFEVVKGSIARKT